MNLDTGERRLVARSGFVLGMVWSDDGTIMFSRGRRGGLYQVREEGGDIDTMRKPR